MNQRGPRRITKLVFKSQQMAPFLRIIFMNDTRSSTVLGPPRTLCGLIFCNLTVEFGVQVHGVRSAMQEIPTFVVLGSACLTIVVLMLSAFHTIALCSE